MNIIGINFESVVDGEGVRVVLYISGCRHNCKGCHNPASHSFTTGRRFTSDLQNEIISYIQNTPFVSGLTLSGGDPMYSAAEIVPFIEHLKSMIPDVSIWIYSGFTYEEICKDGAMFKLLAFCDILVDGEFILEQRDVTLAYRGSNNQRIIDIQKSIQDNKIITKEF